MADEAQAWWLQVRASGALVETVEIWCESSKIDYQNSLDDNAMVSASQSGVWKPRAHPSLGFVVFENVWEI